MATSETKSFAAAVGDWASKSEARITAVRRRSIELLAEEMANTTPNGGKVPFLTGNLARSLLASTSGMPETSEDPLPGSPIGTLTADLADDQPIWLGYQAVYAKRRNYGFVGADSLGRVYNEAGLHFVEHAMGKWQEFVTAAAKELQNSVEKKA